MSYDAALELLRSIGLLASFLRKIFLMPVGLLKPKTKITSGSAGPGGITGMSITGTKTSVSLPLAANPKDPPTGSSDWVAAKKSRVSGGPGEAGDNSSVRVSRPFSTGTFIVDLEDFPTLVPPGSSLALTDYKDSEYYQMEVEEGHETLANNFWDKNKGCDALRFEFFKGGQSLDEE